MKRVWALFDHVINGLAAFAAVLFCFMGLIIICQVFLRYLFNIAPLWINDAVEYILLTATFLGAAYVLKEDQHIEIDIVVNMLDDKKKYLMKMLTSVLGMIVCLTVSWYGVTTMVDNYIRQVTVYKSVEIPKYLVFIPIWVGCVFLSVQFARRVFQYNTRRLSGSDNASSEAGSEKLSV